MLLNEAKLAGGGWRWWRENEVLWRLRHSPLAMAVAAAALLLVLAALCAPLIAPHDPYDVTGFNLLDALTPPAWRPGGTWSHPLGTDDQGRDLLSAILYGMRLSLLVGAVSVALALVIGVALGLVAGYAGGFVDCIIMRIADIQLSFPAILIALLVDGVARSLLPRERQDEIALVVIILAIASALWVQFARTVRGSTLVERRRGYVEAAEVTGVRPAAILLGHILPNVLAPVQVIATINLAIAILTEATLSFLGLGLPVTRPSLGTLIRIGDQFLFSGEWWVLLFPAAALAGLAFVINFLGDWLSDALNPKLR